MLLNQLWRYGNVLINIPNIFSDVTTVARLNLGGGFLVSCETKPHIVCLIILLEFNLSAINHFCIVLPMLNRHSLHVLPSKRILSNYPCIHECSITNQQSILTSQFLVNAIVKLELFKLIPTTRLRQLNGIFVFFFFFVKLPPHSYVHIYERKKATRLIIIAIVNSSGLIIFYGAAQSRMCRVYLCFFFI